MMAEILSFPTADPWMSVRQTADYLGFSTRWVQHQAKHEGLPCSQPGRALRFKRSDVDRWMEERGRDSR